MTWQHVMRPPEGEFYSLNILFGTGEALLTVASDGEEHTLAVDPEDLDGQGAGSGDD